MSEPHSEPQAEPEQRPGTGIDRTVIRKLLALTPAERAKVMIESSNNVAKVLKVARRV